MAAEEGGSAMQLQDFFGWKSPNMTSEYISTSKAAITAMAEKLDFVTKENEDISNEGTLNEKYADTSTDVKVISGGGGDKTVSHKVGQITDETEKLNIVDGGIRKESCGDNSKFGDGENLSPGLQVSHNSKVVIIHGNFSGNITI